MRERHPGKITGLARSLMIFVRSQEREHICQPNPLYSMPIMTGNRKIIFITAAALLLMIAAALFIFRPRNSVENPNAADGRHSSPWQNAAVQSPASNPDGSVNHASANPGEYTQQAAQPPAANGGARGTASLPSPTLSPAIMVARVGVVDMNRVFQEYYKTRQLERKLNEDRSRAKKEMDMRTEKYRGLSGRLAEIDKVLKDRLVNEQLKQQKAREGQSLMEEANRMAREIQEFASRRERQLQDAADRLKRELVKEIAAQARETSKRGHFDFVFDRSGLAISGTPLLPVSREAADLSAEVIADLNRHAPAADAAPVSGPAEPAEAARQ